MDIYPSYTYYLRWTSQNKSYYGVRCANKFPPSEDLWTHYFTSSKLVAAMREAHGEPDVILIDETFDSREDATAYELLYLKANNWQSDEWLNRACFPNVNYRGIPWNKGKCLSEETRKKMSIVRKGRIVSEEQKRKISETLKGRTTHHSEEARKKMSIAKKGKSRPAEVKHRISETLKGRTLSKEHRKNISESIKKWRANNC